MSTITAFESVTVDGVRQGLGRADEDTRGGFTHGGWGEGYQDEIAMNVAGESMSGTDALLFGRRTYYDLLGYWTTTPSENPFTQVLTQTTRYVVSREQSTKLAYPAALSGASPPPRAWSSPRTSASLTGTHE